MTCSHFLTSPERWWHNCSSSESNKLALIPDSLPVLWLFSLPLPPVKFSERSKSLYFSEAEEKKKNDRAPCLSVFILHGCF